MTAVPDPSAAAVTDDSAPARERLDDDWFRHVLGQYPTGVCVVTAIGEDGQPTGMAIGSFTSASLDPPLVAFLPGKRSTSWPKVRAAGRFCINVLGADQEHVCRRFAFKGGDRFDGVTWRPATSGSPILDGVVAWVDCDLDSVSEAGDHYLVLGRVRDLGVGRAASPLIFHRGGYGRFSTHSLAARDADLAEQLRLVDRARPSMEATAAATQSQCIAAHLIDGNVVIIASAGTPASPGLSAARIGSRHPAIPPLGAIWLAYAGNDEVERWLALADSPTDRDRYRQRLGQVRERGYSVGLMGADHERIEAILERRTRQSPDQPLSPEERRLIQALPYDPLDYVPTASDLHVRSFHAPAFGPDGRVALVFVLVGFPRPARVEEARRTLAAVLELADQVTAMAATE
jgi:flavin reductase (DIM6/NTAB) family NADH-FMN oxidoreductase RutF/DNA-binding IclR family transcriptional regulator